MLAALERMLASESFAGISVERLMVEAGISRSTFYNYFEDKADLLCAMTADVMSEISAAMHGWWTLPPTATKADLRVALSAAAETFRPHRALMGAVAEVAPVEPRVRELFLELVAEGAQSVAGYIRKGQAAGSLDPSIDPDTTGEWITWMVERGLYQLTGPDSGYNIERLVEALTEIVWRSLRP